MIVSGEVQPTGGSVGGPSRRSAGRSPSVRAVVLVGAVAVVVMVSHLVFTTGFVLDDWYVLDRAHFKGAWAAGDLQAGPRPGQWVVYAVTFGVFGQHPVLYVLWLGLFLGATAVALLVLACRFVSTGSAVAISVVWLLLPNHMTLEVWPSAVNIDVAVFLMVFGFIVGLRADRSWGWRFVSAGLLGAAVLTYDATVPVAIAGVVLLPLLRRRRVDWQWIAAAGSVLAACGLWMITHWNQLKSSRWSTDAFALVAPAQFGWGIVPSGPFATLAVLVVIIGSAIAVARLVLSNRRPATDTAEWCVVVGWTVIALSLIPFVPYAYEPLGGGDRANCVSAIGGSIVLVGLFQMVWRTRREVALVGAVALFVGIGFSRADRTVLWATAFADADRILAATSEQIPDPDGVIVFGPVPIIESNLGVFTDPAFLRGALRVHYGDPNLDGAVAKSLAEFCAVPEHRRVDIRPLSRLDGNVVVGTCPD